LMKALCREFVDHSIGEVAVLQLVCQDVGMGESEVIGYVPSTESCRKCATV
jgi:hypothetical protein